jgi:hypothetical protein
MKLGFAPVQSSGGPSPIVSESNSTAMASLTDPEWRAKLREEFSQQYLKDILAFVSAERRVKTIYPAEDEVFNALNYTPLSAVKVVILGQDPYINEGEVRISVFCHTWIPFIQIGCLGSRTVLLREARGESAAIASSNLQSHRKNSSWFQNSGARLS